MLDSLFSCSDRKKSETLSRKMETTFAANRLKGLLRETSIKE